MATYNTKSITYNGNTYVMYPGNLTSETELENEAQDATEEEDRVYPVRMDANGKLAVNVPWKALPLSVVNGKLCITYKREVTE